MEDRKQKIIASAKSLFSEKGYAGTGLREIADRAGVSLGNIYNYFKNKEEIFVSIFNPVEIGTTLTGSLEHIAGDFPLNIADVICAIKKTVDMNIDLYRLYYIDLIEFGGKNTNRLFEFFLAMGKTIFREQLDKKVQDGTLRDLDFDFLAKQFVISMVTFFSSFHVIPALRIEGFSDEELSEKIAEVLLHGLIKEGHKN